MFEVERASNPLEYRYTVAIMHAMSFLTDEMIQHQPGSGAERGGSKKRKNRGIRHSQTIEIGGRERRKKETYCKEINGERKRGRWRNSPRQTEENGGEESVTIAVFAISSHPVIRPPRRSLSAVELARTRRRVRPPSLYPRLHPRCEKCENRD